MISKLIDPVAGVLRIAIAIGIVAVACYTGYAHRSPWIILVFAPVFTALYALGKWRAWGALLQERGVGDITKALAATLPIQAILVGVLYLIGLGLGRLIEPAEIAPTLTTSDLMLALETLAIGAIATSVIIWRERGQPDPLAEYITDVSQVAKQAEADLEDDPDAFSINPEPLTEETFFLAPHHSHKSYDGDDDEDQLPLAAQTTPEMIAEAEARLGVEFPDLLRRLYARQNGGYVGWLFVPAVETPRAVDDDWRGAFAIDYSDLVPLDRLRTLKDSYLDFTDADDDEAMARIPENADRMIVLAQRYMDTTYLDYSRPGPPRVGLVDFDGGGEPDVFFDDFETFFAALRREADDD